MRELLQANPPGFLFALLLGTSLWRFGVLALWRYAIAVLNSRHSAARQGRSRCVARLLSLRQQLPLLCCAHTGESTPNSEEPCGGDNHETSCIRARACEVAAALATLPAGTQHNGRRLRASRVLK